MIKKVTSLNEFQKCNLDQYDVIIVSKDFDIINSNELLNVGVDLYSIEDVIIKKNEAKIIKTGVKVYCTTGLFFDVRPRSSLFLKHQLLVANSPGTTDPDYRGDVGLILLNIIKDEIKVKKGIRYCQLLLLPYYTLYPNHFQNHIDVPKILYCYGVKEVYDNWEKILPSIRQSKGFGSTGI